MADNFITCYDAKCSAFQITRLIYVHCVSAEEFIVNLKGFSCAALCCKEIHWSYLESMSLERGQQNTPTPDVKSKKSRKEEKEAMCQIYYACRNYQMIL